MKLSLLFALILSFAFGIFAFNQASYPNSTQLVPGYTLYWRVDLSAGMIYLAFQVATQGWIGFGIAEPTSGSMPGADMVTGKVFNCKNRKFSNNKGMVINGIPQIQVKSWIE